MRDDRERLLHILDAIERIERYAARGREAFEQEELIQNWMVRHLQVIGEAARAISHEFRDKHPEIPWTEIVGTRHVLVHDYFGIDLDVVWRVVDREIPVLKRKIVAILEGLG